MKPKNECGSESSRQQFQIPPFLKERRNARHDTAKSELLSRPRLCILCELSLLSDWWGTAAYADSTIKQVVLRFLANREARKDKIIMPEEITQRNLYVSRAAAAQRRLPR